MGPCPNLLRVRWWRVRLRAARPLRCCGWRGSLCGYAAGQLADGLGPEAARRAALDVAAELEATAGVLRRLARPDAGERDERRALAVELAGAGMSHQQIARQLGVSTGTVWGDLRAARGA